MLLIVLLFTIKVYFGVNNNYIILLISKSKFKICTNKPNKKCKISAKETTKYNDYMEANTKTQY